MLIPGNPACSSSVSPLPKGALDTTSDVLGADFLIVNGLNRFAVIGDGRDVGGESNREWSFDLVFSVVVSCRKILL